MRIPAPIARLGGWFLTPRAALLVAAPAPVVLLVRGPVAEWAALVWALGCAAAFVYDARSAAATVGAVVEPHACRRSSPSASATA